jgi:hypothetical protein
VSNTSLTNSKTNNIEKPSPGIRDEKRNVYRMNANKGGSIILRQKRQGVHLLLLIRHCDIVFSSLYDVRVDRIGHDNARYDLWNGNRERGVLCSREWLLQRPWTAWRCGWGDLRLYQ